MNLYFIFLSLLLFFTFSSGANGGDVESESRSSEPGANTGSDELNDKKDDNDVHKEGTISAFEKYKHLFAAHRARQLDAVKSISNFGDEKQRYELVNVMLKQLFKTLESAKENITRVGFLPGDPFPENQTIREYVSKVLESTAMFGDMVLRLPDTVHDLYDRKKDWQLLLAWSYGFCTQSGTFDGPNEQLLNLMAQEVNIIPADENYVNPYKAKNQERKKFEDPKPAKKKEKKKIRRGPRLSHSEL